MKRTELDALVALAGCLCILAGAVYAFGFGAALILFGIVLLLLSMMKLTRSIILTKEQQEIAKLCFVNVSAEQAYTMYAESLLKCEADRKVGGVRRDWKVDLQRAFRTYVVNFGTFSAEFKKFARGIYSRVAATKFR